MINYQDEHVMHAVYNWLHNITHTFTVFLFPDNWASCCCSYTYFPSFSLCAAGCWSTPSTWRMSAFQQWGLFACWDLWEPSTECQVSSNPLTPHTSALQPHNIWVLKHFGLFARRIYDWFEMKARLLKIHSAQLLGFTLSAFGVKVFLGLSYFAQ